jgi:hypothetical protein
MANSNFVVDTGLQVGPLYIFASNGDIRTSGNIVYTASGPDNIITTPGTSSNQGFLNSTTLYFPGANNALADYSVTQVTVDGVVTTETESGPTNVIPTLDAFGIITSAVTAKVDIYDCMEPTGYVETTDLGVLP